MRTLITIAWKSAWNRRFTLALTVLSIALSTFLLLGVERIRTELRDNFSASVSGTDLIVGSAPPERAGAAAAISETSSEFGGALGIAVLGSVVTAV